MGYLRRNKAREMINPEELLSKVSKGSQLSAEEVEQAVLALKSWYEDKPRENSVNDLYAYLVLLKVSDLKEHHKLVSSFLREKDALIVSLVIEILCMNWNLTEEYLQHIISIAVGLSWDVDGDAREQAIKVLGEYLNQKKEKDSKILELLFGILEDQKNDLFLRKTAYNSINRAMDVEWEDLPADCTLIEFDKEDKAVNYDLLKKAKNLI